MLITVTQQKVTNSETEYSYSYAQNSQTNRPNNAKAKSQLPNTKTLEIKTATELTKLQARKPFKPTWIQRIAWQIKTLSLNHQTRGPKTPSLLRRNSTKREHYTTCTNQQTLIVARNSKAPNSESRRDHWVERNWATPERNKKRIKKKENFWNLQQWKEAQWRAKT